jgi:hypothetical protein
MNKLDVENICNNEIIFKRDNILVKRKIYDPYYEPYIILDDKKMYLNFIDLVAAYGFFKFIIQYYVTTFDVKIKIDKIEN